MRVRDRLFHDLRGLSAADRFLQEIMGIRMLACGSSAY